MLRPVERASNDLAGQRIGQLTALEQHGPVDDDMMDADRVALDLDAAARQIGHRLARLWGDAGLQYAERDLLGVGKEFEVPGAVARARRGEDLSALATFSVNWAARSISSD